MNSILLLGMPGGGELMSVIFVLFIPVLLWLWALIDTLRSDFTNSSSKLIWILLIIILPVLGAIIYLIVGRQQKEKT
jgi:hypothetical protein